MKNRMWQKALATVKRMKEKTTTKELCMKIAAITHSTNGRHRRGAHKKDEKMKIRRRSTRRRKKK